MDVLLEYLHFQSYFQSSTSYYADIDASSYLSCSKLCWHNQLVQSLAMTSFYNDSLLHKLYVSYHMHAVTGANSYLIMSRGLCRDHPIIILCCSAHKFYLLWSDLGLYN